jgi:transcriptional regulator with XRE-family HTH domain
MEASDIVADLLARGWTQVQIAERTGIPQPTLSKIVRKDVQDVMSRSYRKLAALRAEVVGELGEAQAGA